MVSIIVPVYNCRNTLNRCVGSLLAQNYSDIEIILVDDGSTDGSGMICDDLQKKDSRIVVVHKQNGGVSSARNAGIDRAQGEYIAFCDSDDYVSAKWCSSLLEANAKNKRYMPVCNFYRVCGDDVSINFENECSQLSELLPGGKMFSLYSYELLGTPWNKLFNGSIIREHCLRFDTSLSLGEDLLFNLDYIEIALEGITFIKEPLYYYSLGNNESLSARYYPDLYEIYEKLFSKMGHSISKYGCMEEHSRMYWRSCFFAIDRVFRNTFSKNDKRSQIDKWRYNSKIFKGYMFQGAKQFILKGDINVLQYIALKTNSYYLYWTTVRITEKLSTLKHRK